MNSTECHSSYYCKSGFGISISKCCGMTGKIRWFHKLSRPTVWYTGSAVENPDERLFGGNSGSSRRGALSQSGAADVGHSGDERRTDPRPDVASSARQRGDAGGVPGGQQSSLHSQVWSADVHHLFSSSVAVGSRSRGGPRNDGGGFRVHCMLCRAVQIFRIPNWTVNLYLRINTVIPEQKRCRRYCLYMHLFCLSLSVCTL